MKPSYLQNIVISHIGNNLSSRPYPKESSNIFFKRIDPGPVPQHSVKTHDDACTSPCTNNLLAVKTHHWQSLRAQLVPWTEASPDFCSLPATGTASNKSTSLCSSFSVFWLAHDNRVSALLSGLY